MQLPLHNKCLLCGQNLEASKSKLSTFFDCKGCKLFETRILNKDQKLISVRIYDQEKGVVVSFSFAEDKMRIFSTQKDIKSAKIDLEFPLPAIDWSSSQSALNKISTVLMFL